MKQAVIRDGLVKLAFDFDWTLVNYVRQLTGRRYDPKTKTWTCPATKTNVERLRQLGFQIIHPTPETGPILIPRTRRQLFPYQLRAVEFLERRRGRALIADDPGLGKTTEAVAWTESHTELRPVLIVCPAHLKLNWAREIRDIALREPRIIILSGTTPHEVPPADYIIINYDILPHWLEKLSERSPAVLIVDEAHYIKSSKAIRTKTVFKLARGFSHTIALTGTPALSRPIEMYNIIRLVDKTLFPNLWDYARRYCNLRHNGFGWDFSGASNEQELHDILTNTIMIRRTKAEVLTELPDKLYSYVPMQLDNEEDYHRAEKDFVEWLAEKQGNEKAIRAAMAESLVKMEMLRQLAAQGKLRSVIQWVEDFLANGAPLVVFGIHKAVLGHLARHFKDRAVKVDGETPLVKRDEAVRAFQQGKVPLFLGNIRAAGTGLTLTAASAVAFVELPWTPGELVQAEDRCHRIGQKDTVNVYYLLASGSVEERIAALLDKKRKIIDAVVDGREEVEKDQLITELINSYMSKES